MARNRIGDGTTALFDPSDDSFPPFPPKAMLHWPPTLPSRAAGQAQLDLPTEIPPIQAQSHLPTVHSQAAAQASSLALQLKPATHGLDGYFATLDDPELCARTISFTIPGHPGAQIP